MGCYTCSARRLGAFRTVTAVRQAQSIENQRIVDSNPLAVEELTQFWG